MVRAQLCRGRRVATLGKQTNDCGNDRRNTKIESNSDHSTIWKEYSKTGPGYNLKYFVVTWTLTSFRNPGFQKTWNHEFRTNILWFQVAWLGSTGFNINLIALCSSNQPRQDKLIIFFLISARSNFPEQSIPVSENLQCSLRRGLSWGDEPRAAALYTVQNYTLLCVLFTV